MPSESETRGSRERKLRSPSSSRTPSINGHDRSINSNSGSPPRRRDREEKRSRKRASSRSRSRSRSKTRSRSNTYSPVPRRSSTSSRSSRHLPPPSQAYYGRGRYRDGRDNPEPCRCLGIFGMSLHTSEKELEDIFREFGTVDKVLVVRDRATGRSRGFGFVYFSRTKYATRAKEEMQDATIDGMRVRVDYSVTDRPPAPRSADSDEPNDPPSLAIVPLDFDFSQQATSSTSSASSTAPLAPSTAPPSKLQSHKRTEGLNISPSISLFSSKSKEPRPRVEGPQPASPRSERTRDSEDSPFPPFKGPNPSQRPARRPDLSKYSGNISGNISTSTRNPSYRPAARRLGPSSSTSTPSTSAFHFDPTFAPFNLFSNTYPDDLQKLRNLQLFHRLVSQLNGNSQQNLINSERCFVAPNFAPSQVPTEDEPYFVEEPE